MRQKRTINNIEFYKEFYLDELNRKEIIDNSISYPTTMLTLLIGSAIFLFEKLGLATIFDGKAFFVTSAIICLISFGVTIFFAITLLLEVFANSFKKYKYLPPPSALKAREDELIKFYETTSNDNKSNFNLAEEYFQEDMLNYFINYADKNQEINDKRIKSYNSAKKFLILSIILLAAFATTTLLK